VRVYLPSQIAFSHFSFSPSLVNNNDIVIKEDEQEGITLIRGHAYHKFLELYKKGVVSNVKSYIIIID
jgi:hypothetical protein